MASKTDSTYLDRAPWGDDALLENENRKTARERRRLPEGCTSAELYRDVIRIAWPSMVELLLTSLVGMADMIMVGSMPNGDDAISAVSLSNQPKFIFISLMIALNVGVTAAIARARGAGDQERANNTLRQGLLFSLAICILASVVGYASSEALARFMANDGLGEEIIKMSTDYLHIQMAGFFTMGITATCTAALRGVGSTRMPMIYNTLANVLNIILNYLLINGHFGFPALGVIGASLATVAGQTLALIISLVVCAGGRHYFTVKLSDYFKGFKPDLRIMSQITRVGVPALGEQFVMRVGIILFSRQVATLGQPYFATHNICMNIQSMSFMLGQALAVSSTALVGQSLGKRRPDIAEHYSSRCMRLGLAIAVLLGAFFAVGNRLLVGLYSDTEEVLRAAAPVMVLVGIMQPIQIPQFILSGSLRGAGDTRTTAFITMVGVLLMRPIAGHILINVIGAGLMGAWIAIFLDQTIRSLLVTVVYNMGKWKKIVL